MEDRHNIPSDPSSGDCTFGDPVSIDISPSEEASMDTVSRQAWNKLEDDYYKNTEKMHRVPVSLRAFCEEHQYIAPKMVAIGPCYHGRHELQEMEEVKKAATHFFCGDSLEAAYEEVLAVARGARRCYDASALIGISDAAFASMMFHDACFLLLTIIAVTDPDECAPALLRRTGFSTPVVLTDILLLENQIPWPVLEALMTFREVDLCLFIATLGMNVQSRLDYHPRPLELEDHTPPHLLGLFHFYQSGHTPQRCQSAGRIDVEVDVPRSKKISRINYLVQFCAKFRKAQFVDSMEISTSVIEMGEIGIKVTPSKKAVFKDIGLTDGPLFRSLFLPSLRLNVNTACWLLNLAAFETCTARPKGSSSMGEYYVSSYLVLFGTLMDREEDVHELRAKHLIQGDFTNKQTLDFFKGCHANNLRTGLHFYDILKRLESYRREWWLWIAIHRFIYNNIKTIATIFSILGVLIGIFKTILSLKK